MEQLGHALADEPGNYMLKGMLEAARLDIRATVTEAEHADILATWREYQEFSGRHELQRQRGWQIIGAPRERQIYDIPAEETLDGLALHTVVPETKWGTVFPIPRYGATVEAYLLCVCHGEVKLEDEPEEREWLPVVGGPPECESWIFRRFRIETLYTVDYDRCVFINVALRFRRLAP